MQGNSENTPQKTTPSACVTQGVLDAKPSTFTYHSLSVVTGIWRK